MDSNRIFVDTNVIIGAWAGRSSDERCLHSHDIEDNIQYVLCRKMNCGHFITNNIKDYSSFFLLNVLKPSQSRQINQ